MTKPNLINYTEWQAEVERLHNEEPAKRGLTADELAEQYGRSKGWVLSTVLAPLASEGRLVVTKRKAYRSDGQMCWRPEYSIKRGSNAKKQERAG